MASSVGTVSSAAEAALTDADLRVLVRMLRQRPAPVVTRHAAARGRRRGSSRRPATTEAGALTPSRVPANMGELMLVRLSDLIAGSSLSTRKVADLLLHAREQGTAGAAEEDAR